jgi:hypothetical protein
MVGRFAKKACGLFRFPVIDPYLPMSVFSGFRPPASDFYY